MMSARHPWMVGANVLLLLCIIMGEITDIELDDNVEYLNLSNIALAKIPDLSRMGNLIELDLGNNDLTKLPTDAFKDNSRLSVLDLSGNKRLGFPRSGPFLISSSIRVLNMSFCNVVSLHEDTLMKLPKLETLDLRGNPLRYSQLDGIDTNHPTLRKLIVSDANNALYVCPIATSTSCYRTQSEQTTIDDVEMSFLHFDEDMQGDQPIDPGSGDEIVNDDKNTESSKKEKQEANAAEKKNDDKQLPVETRSTEKQLHPTTEHIVGQTQKAQAASENSSDIEHKVKHAENPHEEHDVPPKQEQSTAPSSGPHPHHEHEPPKKETTDAKHSVDENHQKPEPNMKVPSEPHQETHSHSKSDVKPEPNTAPKNDSVQEASVSTVKTVTEGKSDETPQHETVSGTDATEETSVTTVTEVRKDENQTESQIDLGRQTDEGQTQKPESESKDHPKLEEAPQTPPAVDSEITAVTDEKQLHLEHANHSEKVVSSIEAPIVKHTDELGSVSEHHANHEEKPKGETEAKHEADDGDKPQPEHGTEKSVGKEEPKPNFIGDTIKPHKKMGRKSKVLVTLEIQERSPNQAGESSISTAEPDIESTASPTKHLVLVGIIGLIVIGIAIVSVKLYKERRIYEGLPEEVPVNTFNQGHETEPLMDIVDDKDFLPEHSLIVVRNVTDDVNEHELSAREALKYTERSGLPAIDDPTRLSTVLVSTTSLPLE